jgi:hypothetical protein
MALENRGLVLNYTTQVSEINRALRMSSAALRVVQKMLADAVDEALH